MAQRPMTDQGWSPFGRLRILLIEDDPSMAKVVRQALRTQGLCSEDVVCAETLQAGLEALASGGAFELVLLDLHLPDAGASETIRNIPRMTALAPVIVLTGHAREDVAVDALRAGAQDFIHKERFLDLRPELPRIL